MHACRQAQRNSGSYQCSVVPLRIANVLGDADRSIIQGLCFKLNPHGIISHPNRTPHPITCTFRLRSRVLTFIALDFFRQQLNGPRMERWILPTTVHCAGFGVCR